MGQTQVTRIAGGFFTIWTTKEACEERGMCLLFRVLTPSLSIVSREGLTNVLIIYSKS